MTNPRTTRRNKGPRTPLKSPDPFDGILLVDKPAGLTSHDVVHHIRRHFKFRKVGHAGTLDPMATGLLVILIGRGTKLSNLIMGTDKKYEGTFELGVSTDSHDRDGRVISRADPGAITKKQLEQEMANRTGDILQTPPMVSAIKRDGVPLYKLARQGKTVEREPRLIHIFEFSLLGYTPPLVSFRLKCSKGTYVRTLCADLGDALKCGAHLKELRRITSGSLNVADGAPLDTVLQLSQVDLGKRIIPSHQLQQLQAE